MAENTTLKSKEREFIIECIQLYRDLPVLWNIKSKLYHNRDKKNMAYETLLFKYREMFSEATKEDVKKKFNSLRTNYRRELKKYVSSMKSGAGAESIYEPSLWYFNEMSFLHDQEIPVDSESSMVDTDISVAELAEITLDTSTINEEQTIESRPKKKAKKEEKLLDLAYQRLSEKKDDFYYWAMSCAAELRKMNTTQQHYAKKAFADIILEGQLGLLHRHSVNPDNTGSSVHFCPLPSNSTSTPSPIHSIPISNPIELPSLSPTHANPSSVIITAKPAAPSSAKVIRIPKMSPLYYHQVPNTSSVIKPNSSPAYQHYTPPDSSLLPICNQNTLPSSSPTYINPSSVIITAKPAAPSSAKVIRIPKMSPLYYHQVPNTSSVIKPNSSPAYQHYTPPDSSLLPICNQNTLPSSSPTYINPSSVIITAKPAERSSAKVIRIPKLSIINSKIPK